LKSIKTLIVVTRKVVKMIEKDFSKPQNEKELEKNCVIDLAEVKEKKARKYAEKLIDGDGIAELVLLGYDNNLCELEIINNAGLVDIKDLARRVDKIDKLTFPSKQFQRTPGYNSKSPESIVSLLSRYACSDIENENHHYEDLISFELWDYFDRDIQRIDWQGQELAVKIDYADEPIYDSFKIPSYNEAFDNVHLALGEENYDHRRIANGKDFTDFCDINSVNILNPHKPYITDASIGTKEEWLEWCQAEGKSEEGLYEYLKEKGVSIEEYLSTDWLQDCHKDGDNPYIKDLLTYFNDNSASYVLDNTHDVPFLTIFADRINKNIAIGKLSAETIDDILEIAKLYDESLQKYNDAINSSDYANINPESNIIAFDCHK